MLDSDDESVMSEGSVVDGRGIFRKPDLEDVEQEDETGECSEDENEEEEEEEDDDKEEADDDEEEEEEEDEEERQKMKTWDVLMDITTDKMQDTVNETVEKALQ